MPFEGLDRRRVTQRPLSERENRAYIERDAVPIGAVPEDLSEQQRAIIRETAERMTAAREAGKPRMLAFGAHTIKNGLGPVLIHLIEEGWITHLATNGAGIIHDWEFAYQGESSEHVQENMEQGTFGLWEETGYFLNLALLVGAYEGLGYGESIGAMVEREGLTIPDEATLREAVVSGLDGDTARSAAAADLLGAVRAFELAPGALSIPHPFKRFGLQAAAFRLGVPFTGHPMIGHDILYLHPLNCCAAVGRAAERDFLTFAQGVRELDGGVYLSVGSAVMSPMIFEKALSMGQNLAFQDGAQIEDHFMVIVDLAKSHWDWSQGEPPEDNADYYLRYNKTFSRMGGSMRYLCSDNRDFLLGLLQALES